MGEKSLFFNALPDETSLTGYDRNYNADDISDWLSVIWETGVVKDGLQVLAAGGMSVNVSIGKAAIKGKAYINNSVKTLTLTTAPTGSSPRYDYIVLKYNNNVSDRTIAIELRTGTSTVPTTTDLVRKDNVYELMLAYVVVNPNITTIQQSYIKDKRGDSYYCPWFTAVKGYDDYYDAMVQRYSSVKTMTTAGSTVITDLSSNLYSKTYSLINVYTNGMKETSTAYTTSVSSGYIVITFKEQKNAGDKIMVELDNFIDGEGMSTALEQYTQLVQNITKLSASNEYNYICNGVNDNVLIGDIVRTYLEAGTDYGTMKLNVIGNIGMTDPAYGSGTAVSPYGWFNFDSQSNRNAIVDFTRCGQIAPTIKDGTYNHIFRAYNDIHIIGANVVASNIATNTQIRIINTTSGVVKFENCRFYITAYQDSLIAFRGTFINCRGSVANVINNSYCFLPATNGVVKIIGGEYYAYTGDSAKQSAIVWQSSTEAVSILYSVSAPTATREGYYQTHSILQLTGGGIINCTDLISELTVAVVSGSSNIRGTIAKSKIDVW